MIVSHVGHTHQKGNKGREPGQAKSQQGIQRSLHCGHGVQVDSDLCPVGVTYTEPVGNPPVPGPSDSGRGYDPTGRKLAEVSPVAGVDRTSGAVAAGQGRSSAHEIVMSSITTWVVKRTQLEPLPVVSDRSNLT
jgi:hypothetical protein